MRRHVVFVLVALTWAQFAPAQEKFKVRVGTRVSGTEEYQWEKTAEGFRQAGKSVLELAGRPGEMIVATLLAGDRSLVSYKLQMQYPEGAQIVEARREGGQMRLSVQAGPQNPTKTLAWKPGIFLLDNLVGAHYQALLDGAPPEDVPILVPQAMALLQAKFRPAGEAQGALNGQPIILRKHLLEIGGLLTEILSGAADRRLMRVYVPLQDVELIREGFSLAAPPKAEKPKEVTEKERTFQSGALTFAATLALPAQAAGSLPVVVLVHGSGPQDRDETIGPNKPFRDLAHGLATAGIATLRYDKRTKIFREKLDPVKTTVEEEVLADAVAALQCARGLAEADPKRVFLLGHSLGGALAPLIVQRIPEVRGLLLLAASARPLDELILEQTRFQMQRQGQPAETVAAQIDEYKKQFAGIRSGQAKDSDRVLGASALYWRDLFARDSLAALKALTQPVLILQGGKDVQVRKADYDLLTGTVKAEAHWFPGLNHLFMPVEGDPTGSEYGREGKVAPEVIRVIADWINKTR